MVSAWADDNKLQIFCVCDIDSGFTFLTATIVSVRTSLALYTVANWKQKKNVQRGVCLIPSVNEVRLSTHLSLAQEFDLLVSFRFLVHCEDLVIFTYTYICVAYTGRERQRIERPCLRR